MTQAIQLRQSSAVSDALSVQDVLSQVALIQDVMHGAMRSGEHFGTIPGCGDKPTLLQPGAQKLLLTFRMNPDYNVETVDMPGAHREYRVSCRLTNSSGQFIGAGVGSACTMESKWRYRSESTGRPVPQEYWQTKDAKLLGGSQFSARKMAGQWVIVHKVEHDNPADYYNTCLKIAKKRALVDAVVTRTAASDIFTQDVEDLKENMEAYGTTETETPTSNHSTTQVSKPAAVVDTGTSASGDWRSVRLHFGKNKDKELGELNGEQLRWYQEKWEPKEYPAGSGKFSAADVALRRALNESMKHTTSLAAEADKAIDAEADNVPM